MFDVHTPRSEAQLCTYIKHNEACVRVYYTRVLYVCMYIIHNEAKPELCMITLLK